MPGWRQQINKHTVKRPAELAGVPNGKIPASLLVDVHNGNGKRIGRLNRPAARSWTAMVADAKADGVTLDATDTYRPYEVQKRIWDERYDHTDHGNGSRTCAGDKRYLKDGQATVACPGTSKHGDGNAVDDKNQTPATGLTWLEHNAIRYGWEWEVPSEVWHLHYFPGDDIPQAVLDFEAGHQEDDLDANEKQQLEDIHKAVGGLAFAYGLPRTDLSSGEAIDLLRESVARARDVEAIVDKALESTALDGPSKAAVKAAVKEALREGTG